MSLSHVSILQLQMSKSIDNTLLASCALRSEIALSDAYLCYTYIGY